MFLGIKKENIRVFDLHGLVYKDRPQMDKYLMNVACDTKDMNSIKDALKGADILLGLSAGNLVKPEWLEGMNKDPLVMALANPTPEIDPALAIKTRPDA